MSSVSQHVPAGAGYDHSPFKLNENLQTTKMESFAEQTQSKTRRSRLPFEFHKTAAAATFQGR